MRWKALLIGVDSRLMSIERRSARWTKANARWWRRRGRVGDLSLSRADPARERLDYYAERQLIAAPAFAGTAVPITVPLFAPLCSRFIAASGKRPRLNCSLSGIWRRSPCTG